MENLDKKDIGILLELYKNSRMSLAEIGKKLKIPKETVGYRISQLQDKGIINKFYAIVNGSKFGLIFYEVFVKLQGISANYEKKCIEQLSKNPHVCWLVTTSGTYSFICTFLVKTTRQFYEGYDYIKNLFGKYIKDVIVSISIEGQQYEYPFFKNILNGPIKTKGDESVIFEKVDSFDIELLKILSDDCRMPLTIIAAKLGTTEKTVKAHMRQLEKNNLIKQYTVQLHPGRAGYFFNIMLIRLNKSSKDLEAFIRKIPEIFYFVKAVGSFDFKVEFYTYSEDRIHEIEETIYNSFGDIISSIDLLHVKKEHQVRYFTDL